MAIIKCYQVKFLQKKERGATAEFTDNSSLSAESFQVVTQPSGLCNTYFHVYAALGQVMGDHVPISSTPFQFK